MKQNIDKAVLVAEIERRITNIKGYCLREGHDTRFDVVPEQLSLILAFINTLEVKEIGVDLEDPKGDKSSEYTVDTKTFEVKDDVVSNDTISNPLEISRYGNSHIGETLEEAARKVGQKYFPDEENIWARPNYEAKKAEYAFMEGANWQKEQMIDKACEWLSNVSIEDMTYKYDDFSTSEKWYEFINDFKKSNGGIAMEQILELLKNQPKEVLQWIVLELMRDDKLSFADIAQLHVKHLEMLRKGQTEKLIRLRSQVIDLWCSTKKDLPNKLVTLIQEGKDNGWVNITQEQIDNSKWNKK